MANGKVLSSFGFGEESAYFGQQMVTDIENSYISASDYNVFTGNTTSGTEAGWICFKHTGNKNCFGIAFNRYVGIVGMQRDDNGNWHFHKIMGGGIRYFKALYLNALRHLKGGAWHDWKCKEDVIPRCIRAWLRSRSERIIGKRNVLLVLRERTVKCPFRWKLPTGKLNPSEGSRAIGVQNIQRHSVFDAHKALFQLGFLDDSINVLTGKAVYAA